MNFLSKYNRRFNSRVQSWRKTKAEKINWNITIDGADAKKKQQPHSGYEMEQFSLLS